MTKYINQNLPQFSKIDLSQVTDELEKKLDSNLAAINETLSSKKKYTWENLLSVTEALDDQIQNFWSPIHHMNSVVNSPKLREITNACLPLLSDYHTKVSQNVDLFEAIEAIRNDATFNKLSVAKQMAIKHEIRDFRLSGVNLPQDKKQQFASLCKELSQLTQQFEENVLDATMGWKKEITDEELLTGLPEHAKQAAKSAAAHHKKEGWLITLEAPSYLAVMMFASNRDLRREVYEAYVTRASDCGPNAGKWDNSNLMRQIVRKRFELARLLGFDNYAQYSLQTKMVKESEAVLAFLNELAEKSLSKARDEFNALADFAKQELNIEKLEAWDIAYASEKMRKKQYDVSQEDLRPYFPEPQVLLGLFNIIKKLYGVRVELAENVDVWHNNAHCYNLINDQNELQAQLFLDLYARENKRGGAWMDECRVRRRLENNTIQIPVAYVTCNVNAPIGGDPALFTHEEVVTLFHECGHALQHVLTTIDVASVSGINGIPWDAVEVASQFFENWAWEKESIDLFAAHYKTQDKLPSELYEKMQRAKNFQSAMQMVRQLEFSLFDFELHMNYDDSNPDFIQEVLDAVRERMTVVPVPEFNRFQHGFSHIFAGGYAAGYYSYKWAEVMACDAFSLFQEKGIFDKNTSQKFKETFLESGGAKEPMQVFIEFRGRGPSVDALLEQTGII